MARFSTALARLTPRKRLIRGLRFRLAASYLLFFTLLLLGLGLLFRQMLVNIAKEQANELLNEEWAAIKGYLRIEHLRALWYYDYADPEEALIVDRLKSNYLIADENGVVLERAPFYTSLKLDQADEIRARLKLLEQTQQPLIEMMYTDKGVPYLIRSGIMPDEHRRVYYIAIARSLAEGMRTVNQFTWRYVALMPLLVLFCAVLGWMLAGRALDPLKSVAHAAQRITSSNLSTRIPTRGAGDELDYLIVAFNRMIERLNQSFEQMRQFSTDVSHELRTPLTAIRGQLEVALFTAKTPEQYQDAMVNALQDVEKLSNIVRALLLLSQAESGQLVLQMGPLDLSRLVEEVADQFQIPAEAAQLTLTAKVARDCIIRGDKTQIERLLSNLLSNALKYTPAGGRVHITVACERNRSLDEGGNGTARGPGMAMLSVEDTGIGIPADQLPHIFDRFYRVRPSQSNPIQGLGLGLSFVSWIVKAHGGRIEVESTVGVGTRFTVSLPLYQESPARPALEAVPQEKS